MRAGSLLCSGPLLRPRCLLRPGCLPGAGAPLPARALTLPALTARALPTPGRLALPGLALLLPSLPGRLRRLGRLGRLTGRPRWLRGLATLLWPWLWPGL
ncbi:hypothetical protein ACQP1K_14490 [Sphaerimonospora sp. CA-214678]|uniref:hypothetical protein n=1 Tax=Sphaerimonospora sp. CA-214678 TaxID=3240029 RepID=UPI003D8FF582